MQTDLWREFTHWRSSEREDPEPPDGFEDELFSVLCIDIWGTFAVVEFDPVNKRWQDETPLYWSRVLEVLPEIPPIPGEPGYESEQEQGDTAA